MPTSLWVVGFQNGKSDLNKIIIKKAKKKQNFKNEKQNKRNKKTNKQINKKKPINKNRKKQHHT